MNRKLSIVILGLISIPLFAQEDVEFRSYLYNENGKYDPKEYTLHLGDLLVDVNPEESKALRIWIGLFGPWKVILEKFVGGKSVAILPFQQEYFFDLWGYQALNKQYLVVRQRMVKPYRNFFESIYEIDGDLGISYLGKYVTLSDMNWGNRFERDLMIEMMGSLEVEDYPRPSREEIMSALAVPAEELKEFGVSPIYLSRGVNDGEKLLIWNVVEAETKKQGNTTTYYGATRKYVYIQVINEGETISTSIFRCEYSIERVWSFPSRGRRYLYIQLQEDGGFGKRFVMIYEVNKEHLVREVAPYYSRNYLNHVKLWNGFGYSESRRKEDWTDVEEIPFKRWNQFDPPLVTIPEIEFSEED